MLNQDKGLLKVLRNSLLLLHGGRQHQHVVKVPFAGVQLDMTEADFTPNLITMLHLED